MTRQEWFNNQTPEIQEKFKHNCDTLNNGYAFFEPWISGGTTKGLAGAFQFGRSSEGHEFWYKLNVQLKRNQGYAE